MLVDLKRWNASEDDSGNAFAGGGGFPQLVRDDKGMSIAGIGNIFVTVERLGGRPWCRQPGGRSGAAGFTFRRSLPDGIGIPKRLPLVMENLNASCRPISNYETRRTDPARAFGGSA